MFKNDTHLRFPIRDSRGILLVAQGAAVTPRLRQILSMRGISIDIQASLKVLEGDTPDVEIPVNKPFFKIGRRPDCDLQLASPVVSGNHCSIHKNINGLTLEDNQSRNGTFLNDQRIRGKVDLNDQDKIQIGRFVFVTAIYAALAAEAGDGEKALNAWILEEKSPKAKTSSTPFCRTEMEIDLDFPSDVMPN
jgi:pSer/pThr/pTyr-binding forkhead associated (FHA) protein